MATEFTVEEAQERLAELLDRAESGEEIVITRFGAPLVRLQPVRGGRLASASSTAPGMAGGVMGAAWVASSADAPHHDSAGHTGTFDMGTDFWSPDSGVSG